MFEAQAMRDGLHEAAARPPILADRGPVSLAMRSGLRQIGRPSLRQKSEKAQRGRLSPGYHLPWP